MINLIKYLLPVSLVLGLTLQINAQETLTIRSNTSGFNLGISPGIQTWSSDYFAQLDEQEPMGAGVNITVGYGFNQQFNLVAGLGYHNFQLKNDFWDTFDLVHFDLGLRYNFGGTLQAFRPYVEAGVKSQLMEIAPIFIDYNSYTYTMKGVNFQVGGGLNYFINPRLALNVYGKFAFGKFRDLLLNDFSTGETPDIFTSNIGLGINYYFNAY